MRGERNSDFFGTTIRASELGGLVLTESVYGAGLAVDRHVHEVPYFCFVVRGSYVESVGRRARSCRAGNIVFHPPHEEHANRFGEVGGRCFNVQLGPSWSARLEAGISDPWPTGHVLDGPATWLGSRLYSEFYCGDTAAALVIEGLVLAILGEVARSVSDSRQAEPRWLSVAHEFIREHYLDSISLADVAAVAGVHPVHAARVFRARYGASVGEYVRHLRLRWARDQIAAGGRTLSQIAFAAGFSDQAHLTRSFHRVMGITPAEHRRMAARGSTSS